LWRVVYVDVSVAIIDRNSKNWWVRSTFNVDENVFKQVYFRWYEKAPSHRSQNYIWKTRNVFCGNTTEILWKSASPRKLSLKLANRLLSYGQKKRFSVWRSAILNFENFQILLHDCHQVPNLHLCTKFIKVVEIWRFNDFQDGKCPNNGFFEKLM